MASLKAQVNMYF